MSTSAQCFIEPVKKFEVQVVVDTPVLLYFDGISDQSVGITGQITPAGEINRS